MKTKRIVPKVFYCLRYCFLLTKDCMHNKVWGCVETLPICLLGLWSSLNVWTGKNLPAGWDQTDSHWVRKVRDKKREISAFGTLYGGQLPLSIDLINLIICLYPSSTKHHSLNLLPLNSATTTWSISVLPKSSWCCRKPTPLERKRLGFQSSFLVERLVE